MRQRSEHWCWCVRSPARLFVALYGIGIQPVVPWPLLSVFVLIVPFALGVTCPRNFDRPAMLGSDQSPAKIQRSERAYFELGAGTIGSRMSRGAGRYSRSRSSNSRSPRRLTQRT